ncbi:hypothetical protein [Dyadobacter jiangsuensis]|uniref:Uncharacterized protein n=1 Tax=Dyadobacter jiangsuensis TaxID=1591085 RepID=A0A2P8FN63_9BACT|nr:hypothetical protein [Dyadobacter jiangsuensis]PSL23167.1 hypothetical protein CLV60_11744 [Dyadobacter jiangsuensis]
MKQQNGAEVRTPYLLKFHDLFPNEEIDVDLLLQAFSKEMLLHAAINFSGYHNHFDRDEDIFSVLRRHFRGHLTAKLSQILNNIYRIQQQTQRAAHFIYPPSSLKLFEYALKSDKSTEVLGQFDEDEGSLNLFKAYLCFNEDIMLRAHKASQLLVDYSSDRIEYLTALTGSVFDNEILNHNLSLEFSVQFQKSQYLFLFLRENEKTRPLLLETLKYYNCRSIGELFNMMIFLLDPIECQKDAIIDIRDKPMSKLAIKFIDKFVLAEFEENMDFLSIRNTPVMKMDDGLYKIIYAKFVIDKLFRGWYFVLNRLNSTLELSIQIKNFRSFYSTEFTEEYLLTKLLHGVFPKKAISFSGREIRVARQNDKRKEVAEPDYYVRDFNNIFLIECKDALIKKEAKESLNYLEIDAELRSKFLETTNGGKRQSKAIHQLLDNIQRIKSGNIDFDRYDKMPSVRIYPILILTEEVFNATGLNQLINEWFGEELGNRRDNSGIKLDKIEPLTIITVDSLIYIRPYLIAGRVKFKDMVDSYINEHLTRPTNTKLWERNRMIPFSLFSRSYIWRKCNNSLQSSMSIFVEGYEDLDSSI